MFERLGNTAHLEIEHTASAAVLSGDQTNMVSIVGLSLHHAHHLAHTIITIIHPEYAQKK